MPSDNAVTFVDNHDTGKEHDKWITKDYAMAYAYILTHEGTPCVFYPHFYSVIQYDVNDHNMHVKAPESLRDTITKLIEIRQKHIGGGTAVLNESGNPQPEGVARNVYVARRQGGNGSRGAIVVLNNNDSDSISITLSVNHEGFENLSGAELADAFNPSNKIVVGSGGRATFITPPRSFTIWLPSGKKTN